MVPTPVVRYPVFPACHPYYPGEPQMTWQRWWSSEPPPENGVDALTGLMGLHLGSLHATVSEVARSHP